MVILQTFSASLMLMSILGSALFTSGVPFSQAFAQAAPGLRFNTTANSFEGEGRPPSRTSAGSRDACLAQLVALVPGEEDIRSDKDSCSTSSETRVALTIAEQPTFWFYIPEQFQDNATAEFVLLDDAQQPIVFQPVVLQMGSGIVGVSLAHPLDSNTTYRWVFSVDSSTGTMSQSVFVEGLVRRIEPDENLRAEIAVAESDLERARIYASHGIWHDALTLLIGLQNSSPNSALSNDWLTFLESVGLGAIANAPVLACCTSTQLLE